MHPRHQYYLGLGPHGFHRLHYTEWGEADNPKVLICVHGLTRCCRDFDFLAQALAADYRVICPDIAGRGESQWLSHAADYSYPQYAADMNALIARCGAEQVDWVGTSMGGLIGLTLAAQANSPIRRLVMNDVGAVLPRAALLRIAEYVGLDPHFNSLEQMEQYIRQVAAPFGPLSDAQWQHLTVHAARTLDNGRYAFRYDPKIAYGVRLAAGTEGKQRWLRKLWPFKKWLEQDVALWLLWDAVRCPVLLLRGSESDLLLSETAHTMTQRGPKAQLHEFSGIGHAPVLMDSEQIQVVADWLRHQH